MTLKELIAKYRDKGQADPDMRRLVVAFEYAIDQRNNLIKQFLFSGDVEIPYGGFADMFASLKEESDILLICVLESPDDGRKNG